MRNHLTRRQRRAGRVKRRQEPRDPFLELPPEEQARRNAQDREAAQRVTVITGATESEVAWLSLGPNGLRIEWPNA